jgi:hypothetical protein
MPSLYWPAAGNAQHNVVAIANMANCKRGRNVKMCAAWVIRLSGEAFGVLCGQVAFIAS